MLPYGSRKRGAKLHPHNECGICGHSKAVKARERSMTRLIESARYSEEMAETNMFREAVKTGEVENDWAKAAKHIQEVDPEGKESFRVLKIMEVDRAMRESKLKRKQS